MRVVGLTIEQKPETVRVMGRPYAYLGGVVDLDPASESRVVVDCYVSIEMTLDDGRVFRYGTPVGARGGVREYLSSLRMYEEAYNENLDREALPPGTILTDDVPVGITDAFEVYLQDQGIEL